MTRCFILLYGIIFMAILLNWPTNDAARATCHCSNQSITPLKGTKHLMVSAYIQQGNGVKGLDLRMIAVIKKDAMVPLHCIFCCAGDIHVNSTPASLHGDMGWGFPFEAKFVTCRIPTACNNPTHVTLSINPDSREARQQSFLPIRNQGTGEMTAIMPQFDLTVCISTLYGDYNNVLQFTQALEMYRLLGVDRVMVYNTSVGPDLDRLLHSYSQEGFVEMVPWPIDKHLTPSRGCYPEHGGDLHYYGQMATLNDCVYRNIERSRYVLLHDIDEIIVPYRHDSLKALMSHLQKQEPMAGVFKFQMDLFPTDHVTPLQPPQWEGVPGINILEHIHRINRAVSNTKMIVQPRMVEEISVHWPVKYLGSTFDVPSDMARVFHIRSCQSLTCKGQPYSRDTRLWHFHEKLIASVDKALGRIGMLKTKSMIKNVPQKSYISQI